MNQVPNTMSSEQALSIVEEVRRRTNMTGQEHDAVKVAISVLAQIVAAHNKSIEQQPDASPEQRSRKKEVAKVDDTDS